MDSSSSLVDVEGARVVDKGAESVDKGAGVCPLDFGFLRFPYSNGIQSMGVFCSSTLLGMDRGESFGWCSFSLVDVEAAGVVDKGAESVNDVSAEESTIEDGILAGSSINAL